MEWSVALRALPGEAACGDAFLAEPNASGMLLAAVDGLGHGEEAAEAAEAAIACLKAHAGWSVPALLESCHAALENTRGAAVTLASIHRASQTVTWAGVGDVEAILVRAAAGALRAREYVPQRGGVAGLRLPHVRPATQPIERGDLLIFATDGISRSFGDESLRLGSPSAISTRILEKYALATDDALVFVARVVGEEP